MSGKKRARNEKYEERKVTLPNKKTIRLVSRAERNLDAAYAKSAPQYVLTPVQSEIANAMDIAEGERAAALLAMGRQQPSLYSSSFVASSAPSSYRRVKRAAKASAKAPSSYRAAIAKKASKASLARARTSAKKGGTAIPKATLMKAANKGSYMIFFRDLMKKTVRQLRKAINLEPKSVLAACLAKRYAKN